MPRWLWWLPLVVLTIIVGLFVFRLGWIRAHLTETDVINHFAARYVVETGGQATVTDCVALPGQQEGVWLVVRCAPPDGGAVQRFPVDRSGRLLAPAHAVDAMEPRT